MLAIIILFAKRIMLSTKQINSLILINLKVNLPVNHISFLIHTLGILIKHVADKNKTFAIILNLAS